MQEEVSANLWRERFIAYAPLLFWIGVIFFLSSSAGSFGETSRFIGPILRFLFPDAPPDTISYYHGIIRKLAHVTVYAILAILIVRSIKLQRRSASWLANFGLTLGIVILVGTLDETNQSFLTTRTGSPWDVLLDLLGGCLGMLSALFVYRDRERQGDARPLRGPTPG